MKRFLHLGAFNACRWWREALVEDSVAWVTERKVEALLSKHIDSLEGMEE